MNLGVKKTLFALAVIFLSACASTERHEPVLDFVAGTLQSYEDRQKRANQPFASKTDDDVTKGDAVSGVLNVFVQSLNRLFNSEPENN